MVSLSSKSAYPTSTRLPLIPAPGADTEDIGRQPDAGRLDPIDELRPQARRHQPANDLSVLNAGLLKREDLRHRNDIAFHALHFRDGYDAAGAIAHAFL